MIFNKTKRAVMLIVISAVFIYPQHIVAHASKADVTGEKPKQAVETFITDFYEAHTEENIDSIQEQLEDSSQSRIYIAQCRALLASGFEKYDNIVIKVYPLEKENFYLATVAYDAFFEGIDIGLPGADTVMAKKEEDGRLVIVKDYVSSDLYEEVLRITTSEEIVELMNEENAKLNAILVENPAIWDWLTEMNDELTKQRASYLENSAETPDSDVYTVKKGDCLWSIAERELGDGMRWSKVYEANKNIIGENPNLILAGMQLRL